jgi:DNA-binding transcriptional ArsR family regulator
MVVTSDMLKDLAKTKPEELNRGRRKTGHTFRAFDLPRWIEKHIGDNIRREGPYQRDGHRWVLKECPGCHNTDKSAFILQFPDGVIGGGCQHNTCGIKSWRDLRRHYEPDAYDQVSPSSSLIGEGRGDALVVTKFSEMVPPNKPRDFLVEDLIPARFPSAIHGDGGVTKSLNAAHLSHCVARGVDWLGRKTMKTDAMLLDFELDQEEQARRNHEIAEGMGYDRPPENYYYLCAAGAKTRDAFDAAYRHCVDNEVGFMVVDSIGVAMQGDNEAARDVLGFFREVLGPFRAAGITVLLIDHQSKLQHGESYQNKTMFGSVYKSNMVRSVVQIEARDREEGSLSLTMRHKKTNFGALQDPFGVRVAFEYGKITVEKEDLSHADLAEEGTVSAKERVLKALEDGPAYPDDIAEVTGLAPKTVKNKLTDLRKAGKVKTTGNKSGQSEEVSLASLSLKGRGQGHLHTSDFPEIEFIDGARDIKANFNTTRNNLRKLYKKDPDAKNLGAGEAIERTKKHLPGAHMSGPRIVEWAIRLARKEVKLGNVVKKETA